jgi:cell division septum initiation protein DivIVA
MRGYQRDEVDELLEQIAAEIEAEKHANLKLTMELDSVKIQFQALKEHENAIKDAAIDARRFADKTVSEAKSQADEMLSRAEVEAKQLLESKQQELREIETCVIRAKDIQDSFLAKLRELIENHLEMADKMNEVHCQSQATQDALEITDSSEVSRNSMETIATQPGESQTEVLEEGEVETDPPEEVIENQAPAEEGSGEPQKDDETAVDPELSAALKSYQSSLNERPDSAVQQNATEQNDAPQPAPPEQFVETTALASDVPEGFVSENQEAITDEKATTKLQTQGRSAVIQDLPAAEPNDAEAVDPDDLADELDKVVAKFEEEMDKAAETK